MVFGFFKQAANLSRLQKELSALFAQNGLNFMHMQPDIHKAALGLARKHGSEEAFRLLMNMMAANASHPGRSPEKIIGLLVDDCRLINERYRW